jgi:transcriptional regulator with XRE-family HTH domain
MGVESRLTGCNPEVTVSPPKRVSMNLRKLRRKRRMSQAALATNAGVSREYVARLETGHHDPSLSTLQKLAKALGVPVASLLE